jgi:glycerophosphoryl diester phosphodiesterase
VSGPLRLAHRGDHREHPENTLAAFRAALAVPGCDGLEFDVRLSADGIPVILHDETLGRVQGIEARCDARSAAELAELGVPTLAEVLALAGPTPFLDVELKEDCGPAGVATLEAMRGDGAMRLARAVVSSFEPEALLTVRRLRPEWPCWLNAEDLEPATVARAVELGCRGLSAEWTAVGPESVARVRAAGLELATWTVTDVAEVRRLGTHRLVAICVEGEALDRA